MAERRRLVVTPVAERPVVALCAGKDCRKRCEFAKVREILDRDCEVIQLRCVGLCSGPVVVTGVTTDAPVVYSKLRTKRQGRLLVDAAAGDAAAADALTERHVEKRKVLVSVSRQLERRSA